MNTLKPFKRFCITLGEIPSSYLESMSYYETLVWLCNYLNKTIEPSIIETQQAVTELQEFVSHYFDNLDVQEEINTKLDEMAESGQLTDIIAQYLQLAGLLCFNTKANLKSAENLSDGSFTKTFGTLTYNDGKGEFYKIRQLLNTDVVDDENILALSNYPTLIAEKMTNYYINNLNSSVNLLTNKKYIFIGDSYNTDTAETPWSLVVRNSMGLTDDVNCFRSGVGGAGWVHNSGHTFLEQLQTLGSSISNKSSITDIIVCGGVNDVSENMNDVYNAINTFASYCTNNYPNAKVHVGMISWVKGETGRGQLRTIINYYNNSSIHNSNMVAISNAQTFFHDYGKYQVDGHPTSAGSYEIGGQIANYLKGGVSKVIWNGVITYTGNASVLITDEDNIFTIENSIDGNNVNLNIKNLKSYLTSGVASLSTDTPYKIGQTTSSPQYYWFQENYSKGVIQTGTAYIRDSSDAWHELRYRLSSYQKDLYLMFIGVGTSGTITVSNPRRIYLYADTPNTLFDTLYC